MDNLDQAARRWSHRQGVPMLQAGRLTDGQLVTLLAGVALELLPLHESGDAYGPIHPAHVRLDATGRPQLAGVATPPGWTSHDDWVSLLRLGRHLGVSTRAQSLSWESVGELEGVDLVHWLMRWSTPEPLPLCGGRLGGADETGLLREVVS